MKRIIILFFATLSVLCASAQINNSIWGLTLGFSRTKDLKSYLHEHKMNYKDYCDDFGEIDVKADYCTIIPFGGIDWDSIEFTFQNDVLRHFEMRVSFDSDEDLHKAFTRLREALLSRYKEFLNGFKDDPECRSSVGLKDSKTSVILFPFKKDKELLLSYSFVNNSSLEDL